LLVAVILATVPKLELAFHDQEYARLLDEAQAALASGRCFDAIKLAVDAWEHVDGMMSYRRKYEKEEFRSVDCFDLVLSMAPLLFESNALDQAAEVLKSKRGVERHTSDDLGERLSRARLLLRMAHQLWRHLAAREWTPQAQLRSELGGSQDEWRGVVDRWTEWGLLERRGQGLTIQLRFATDLERAVKAKCHACGKFVQAKGHDLLQAAECPRCRNVTEFTVTGEISAG